MTPATDHRVTHSGRTLTAARVLLALQAVLLAVPAGILLVEGSKGTQSSDELTAGLAPLIVVFGLVVAAFAAAVAACSWKLTAGRGVRIATVVLEVLIALLCLPQSVVAPEDPVPFGFPAMAVLAAAIAVLVGRNVSGRR
ncbi:hypothetical protein DZF91_12835 [Actinomadura logoneensis]|uniref:Uncharacterized protein n=1 Tax=Actinomadura logoneensis TaxID=2293572 RepID=A0A372JPK1_9ACTN|nr:hypothetical protein [Actinomadura logoneensis]RFU41258.1 hypothetical protein DZF91_12835 [Actinomadura logoneensis]